MTMKEVSIRIGGAAGDGVSSTGDIFAKTSSRSGLHVYAFNSYQSVIRGGHVWYQIRASGEKVLSVGQNIDILIALNTQSVDVHLPHVRPGGAIIFDPAKVKCDPAAVPEGVTLVPIPLLESAKEFSTNAILANTVALGAAMELIGADFDKFSTVIKDQFGHKSEKIVEANVGAAKKGWDMAAELVGRLDYALPFSDKRRAIMPGNHAIALGLLAGGGKFYSFYPMTPASTIGDFLATNGPPHGMVVKQAEDEIAVVNMAIGAAYAGARSACGTSGGGFALMVEALGFAAITETPLVVALAQRGGPSTGLPTKTEQGDLNLMLGAGQGDYPRIIVAPRNVEEAFYEAARALNLAEKYQLPVLLASDLVLSEHMETVDDLNMNVPIERGAIITKANEDDEAPYLRYKITDSGVSARAIPGLVGYEHIAGSDEHDEDATLVSDVRSGLPDAIQVRIDQMDKRWRKLTTALKHDIQPPELHGPADAPLTLVYWGSTQGTAREAIQILNAEGVHVNALEFKDIFPLPVDEVLTALKACKFTLFVEGNQTGQFQRLLRAETGFWPDAWFRKYDGEPIWPDEIVAEVKACLKDGAPKKTAAGALVSGGA